MTRPSPASRPRRRARLLLLAGALFGLLCVGTSQHTASSPRPPPTLSVVSQPRDREITETLIVGVNRITFRWDSQGIDPASIQLNCLDTPGEIQLMGMELERDTGELTWRVFSDTAGPARFQIACVAFD